MAGTALRVRCVPTYSLKNTPSAAEAAMGFDRNGVSLVRYCLNDGVVVGPRLFETVSEQFYRLAASRTPNQEASGGSTESAYHPQNIFHVSPLLKLVAPPLDAVTGNGVCYSRGGFRRLPGTTTLSCMDSVRFGRALGIGARAAAKTLVTAVDAATSPNPSNGTKAGPSSSASNKSKVAAAGERAGQQAARTTTQVRQTGRGLKHGTKRFGEAAWGPFVKLSGVLWLEVTGVFFGIFALFAGVGAWKLRGDFHPTATNHEAHVHLLFSLLMAVVFGYFCVSSFVRASRRQHGQ
jgi:hypothetical protein